MKANNILINVLFLSALLVLLVPQITTANEVIIVDAKATQTESGWNFDVTLEHEDSGWEHYADAWRVLTRDDKELGTRTLFHPHENEQPFTRSLNDVKIPSKISVVYIEAHDIVHGWSPDKFKLILK